MGKLSSLILNSDQVKKKLERIAFQIIEEYHNEKELFIVGISNNGFLLAKKLKDLIHGGMDYGFYPQAINVGNEFLVGFGLDYNGIGRNLRDIYIIEENK